MTTENKNSQSQDEQAEFNQEQFDILRRCSEKKEITEWNTYRTKHPDIKIKLQNVYLQGANLWQADLHGAILRLANLKEADLKEANLKEANLQGAILQDANLWGAHLERANLQGAILQDAHIEGVHLGEIIELKGTYTRRSKRRRATVRTLLKSTEQVELVINLADDITYEEVTNLLRAFNGLYSSLVGFAPYLNEIQIGQHTEEYAAWEGGQT